MSTQQDIYAAGYKNCPPMLNKENYVPWPYRLLRCAKSRPNGKLIHNSIINGPYVRRMIPEPGDTSREVPMNETFYVQTDDELTKKNLNILKLMIKPFRPFFSQMMKGSNIRIHEKKTKLFNEWEMFTSNDGESIESYYHRFLKLMNDLKRNKHFPEKIASNLKFLNNLQREWSRHKEVDELKAERLAKTQDPLALMETSNNRYKLPVPHQDQPLFNQNYMQQPMPNPKDITDTTTAMNMALSLMAKAFKLNYLTPTNKNLRILLNPCNRQIAQPGIKILNGIGNLVAALADGNATGHNRNQIRCYNYRGVGHFARNHTVRPRRRDAAYLQTQLLIAQKEEAGIQLQAEEFDLMAAAVDLDEIKEVTANYILMESLQQASTSGTQTDKAPVYDSDGSAENDNVFISEVTGVEQDGETLEQYSVNFEETRALYESLYQNLVVEVEKVNSVNRKLKETNAHLTTELASQDIVSVVQNNYVGETSNLQIELERTKEHFENCIIKKENYAKLWNDWYKKCEECKFDKISYDKAYKDMQQKIEWLQAQLGDLKGKSKDTSCASDTLNPLSQKLENENVELVFQLGETHALSKPVTFNSTPTPQESNVVKNDKVIAPGMFRINSFKTSREERIDNTKTRSPQPRSNIKNDRVSSTSKCSCIKNKGVEVEEHHRNLLLS
nr:hypothetical protein [Tanacetum cinerariifolium]